jgi:hypothetical protein
VSIRSFPCVRRSLCRASSRKWRCAGWRLVLSVLRVTDFGVGTEIADQDHLVDATCHDTLQKTFGLVLAHCLTQRTRVEADLDSHRIRVSDAFGATKAWSGLSCGPLFYWLRILIAPRPSDRALQGPAAGLAGGFPGHTQSPPTLPF